MEVPVTAIYDVPNKHKKNPVSHGYDLMANLIGEIGYKRPMLAFGVIGCILAIIGLGCGSWAFTTYYVNGRIPFTPTFASGILLVLGMLFIMAGLILNTLVIITKSLSHNGNQIQRELYKCEEDKRMEH
jgi:hypothetical protein